MLETDDLTSLTDVELAKWHAEAEGAGRKYEILAENEWRMRPMREQHRLNKRVVIIAAVISALSGIFGGLVQRYIPVCHPAAPQLQTQIQSMSGKEASTKATTPLTEPHATATTRENVSSKIPPKGQE
jgi:hypothetical protein